MDWEALFCLGLSVGAFCWWCRYCQAPEHQISFPYSGVRKAQHERHRQGGADHQQWFQILSVLKLRIRDGLGWIWNSSMAGVLWYFCRIVSFSTCPLPFISTQRAFRGHHRSSIAWDMDRKEWRVRIEIDLTSLHNEYGSFIMKILSERDFIRLRSLSFVFLFPLCHHGDQHTVYREVKHQIYKISKDLMLFRIRASTRLSVFWCQFFILASSRLSKFSFEGEPFFITMRSS